MYYDLLMRKIKEKRAVLGVIGLGYVGLPLAVEKARAGYRVLGFDLQKQKADMVNEGHNYIGDILDSDLKELVDAGKVSASCDFSLLSTCDCIAICVPTPLDKFNQPDISYVQNSAKEVAKHAHKGMLIVLESTTYPGTTEEVIKPLFEELGFTVGQDVFIAFSPERVDPGNKIFKTKNTPKVVGGTTKNCTEVAAELYGTVLEGDIFKVSSPKVAEMEKLLENTFRNINIALSNEMAVLCERMGIPIWEVIDAAKTKPYGFMAFYPGPGIGGHCIPVDPFYLTWKAREYNYHTRMIELAGEINNAMPEYCMERISRQLNQKKKPLNGSKIFVLGLAYKPDIDDLRESPSLDLLHILNEAGCVVYYNDPFIDHFEYKGLDLQSVSLDTDSLKDADLVVIATAHSAYDAEFILEHARLVFDTRNLTQGLESTILERL